MIVALDINVLLTTYLAQLRKNTITHTLFFIHFVVILKASSFFKRSVRIGYNFCDNTNPVGSVFTSCSSAEIDKTRFHAFLENDIGRHHSAVVPKIFHGPEKAKIFFGHP